MATQSIAEIRSQSEVFIAENIGESLMAAAYIGLEREGMLPTVFYERIPSLREFLGWMERPNCYSLGCFVRRADTTELCGLGYAWDVQGPAGGRRADVGMAFFKKHHRTHVPLDATREMLSYCFNGLGLNALYASVPEPNKLAWRFAERLGFTNVGPLPARSMWEGKPVPEMMLYLTSEKWAEMEKYR